MVQYAAHLLADRSGAAVFSYGFGVALGTLAVLAALDALGLSSSDVVAAANDVIYFGIEFLGLGA